MELSNLKQGDTMKRTFFILTVFLGILLNENTVSAQSKGTSPVRITAETAKQLMDSTQEYLMLDVRTPNEFSAGHIHGAVLLPDYEIQDKASQVIPKKDTLLIVYCRSGRRSAAAAKKLVSMGYTQVYDMGGIISWPYGVEK
jgi:rhodanese-related sulfurtransferase